MKQDVYIITEQQQQQLKQMLGVKKLPDNFVVSKKIETAHLKYSKKKQGLRNL